MSKNFRLRLASCFTSSEQKFPSQETEAADANAPSYTPQPINNNFFPTSFIKEEN